MFIERTNRILLTQQQTVSVLGSLILAMLLYPDVQRAAQEEVDRVIGNDRLPEYDDKASLPYITAMVKEALRRVFRASHPYSR